MSDGTHILTLTYPMPERLNQRASRSLDPRDGKQRWMFGKCVAPGGRPMPNVGIGESDSISLKHAQIRFDGRRFVLEDLRSRFGTQIRRAGNTRDVGEDEIVLEAGDVIIFPGNIEVEIDIQLAT